MRFIQTLLDKLVCLILLLAGGLILAWFLSPLPARVPDIVALAPQLEPYLKGLPAPNDPQRTIYLVVGGLLAAIGFLTFIPRFPKKVARMLRLTSQHGSFTVDLRTVQRSLTQIAKALPEVVDVDLVVRPTKDKKKFAVAMDVVLMKDGPSSAKSMKEKLERAMMASAANVLGSDLVTTIDIHVRDVRLSKNANIIDIATLPAPAENPKNYIAHDSGERWSQREASEPSYLDSTSVKPNENAGYTPTGGYQPPMENKAAAPEPSPEPEMPVEEKAAPLTEPEEEPESPFHVPTSDREPMDTIDSIIMVDEADAERIGGNSIFDEEHENEEENRSY